MVLDFSVYLNSYEDHQWYYVSDICVKQVQDITKMFKKSYGGYEGEANAYHLLYRRSNLDVSHDYAILSSELRSKIIEEDNEMDCN